MSSLERSDPLLFLSLFHVILNWTVYWREEKKSPAEPVRHPAAFSAPPLADSIPSVRSSNDLMLLT